MTSPLVRVNPNFLLLHRNGSLFAGKISGVPRPFQLQQLDILLLSVFLTAEDIKTGSKKFLSNPIVKRLIPQAIAEQIYPRVEELISSNILIKTIDNADLESSAVSDLIVKHSQCKDLANDSFHLSSNIALSPEQKGFKIWLAQIRKYVVLSIEQTLVLLSFSGGKTIEEVISILSGVIDKNAIKAIITSLIDNRVIIKSKDVTSPQAEIQKNDNITPRKEKENSWDNIKLDGRIPVYFLPHMQNHFPLALGLLYTSIGAYDNGSLLEKYLLVPITFMEPEEFINGPYKKFGNGVWLFSNYMWSVEVNTKISDFVKSLSAGNLMIHGGPSTPEYKHKCFEFFDKHQSVDIAVHGEGEIAIVEILERLSISEGNLISYDSYKLSQINGISFRNLKGSNHVVIRTNSRERMQEPDNIPSPYTLGIFNNYDDTVEAAIIESNRGCPFSCTFCDWGSAINQKIRKYDLDRVKSEISWIANKQTRVLWIADANFGMYDRDIEIAAYIAELKKKFGYPQEVVVNYTKNTTWRLAEIIKIFSNSGIISQGVISIQTTDKTTLKVINRKNIKTEKYDDLSKIFRELKLPLSTDLMLGLPGSTIHGLKEDLQRYFDLDVSVKAYPTQLLPNSPMANPEYLDKYQIKTDENNYLISSYSYSKSDLDDMKMLYHFFTIADGYALLRFVLRFLQWEHDIRAIDFICLIKKAIENNPNLYPRITFAFEFFEMAKCMPGGWHEFFNEIAELIYREYAISRDSVLDTVLKVNELAMPDESRIYPVELNLEHSFVDYFLQFYNENDCRKKRLKEFSEGSIVFNDIDGMAELGAEDIQYDTHQYFWEVQSPVAREKSVYSINV